MTKEQVNKFDLEAAFKALDEIETPKTEGLQANRVDLKERFNSKSSTEVLVEEFYDVNVREDLETAQEEREAEIAKAKLARIEKIVDLDAESEEDLLPSYVGKVIIQCPQCMTLFYKNQEDIEKSEENPEVVNINEICQHCGNSSGYTLIGKVDAVGEEEAENYDVEDFEDNELNLDFDTEEVEEEPVEDNVEDVAAEEGNEEELELEPVEEVEEEEEVKESLTLNEKTDLRGFLAELEARGYKKITKKELDEIAAKYGVKAPYDPAVMDRIYLVNEELTEEVEEEEEIEESLNESKVVEIETDQLCSVVLDKRQMFVGTEKECEDYIKKHNNDPAVSAHGGLKLLKTAKVPVAKEIEESLTEDLDDQIKEWNDYVDHLQAQLKDEEDRLTKAKNELVKKSIQAKIDALKAELDEALPAIVKDEIKAEDLPTPEEVDLNAAENTEEVDTKEEAKESLTEAAKKEMPWFYVDEAIVIKDGNTDTIYLDDDLDDYDLNETYQQCVYFKNVIIKDSLDNKVYKLGLSDPDDPDRFFYDFWVYTYIQYDQPEGDDVCEEAFNRIREILKRFYKRDFAIVDAPETANIRGGHEWEITASPKEETKESLNLSKETSENGTEHKSESLTLNETFEEDWVAKETDVTSQNTLIEIVSKALNSKLGNKVTNNAPIGWSTKYGGVAVLFDINQVKAEEVKQIAVDALKASKYNPTKILPFQYEKNKDLEGLVFANIEVKESLTEAVEEDVLDDLEIALSTPGVWGVEFVGDDVVVFATEEEARDYFDSVSLDDISGDCEGIELFVVNAEGYTDSVESKSKWDKDENGNTWYDLNESSATDKTLNEAFQKNPNISEKEINKILNDKKLSQEEKVEKIYEDVIQIRREPGDGTINKLKKENPGAIVLDTTDPRFEDRLNNITKGSVVIIDGVERLPNGKDIKDIITRLTKQLNCKVFEITNESLNEDVKIISDLSDYEPWSGAVDAWNKIQDANKVEELDAMLEEVYPDGLTMTELNDILWFDSEWVLSSLGIIEAVEEDLSDIENQTPADIEQDLQLFANTLTEGIIDDLDTALHTPGVWGVEFVGDECICFETEKEARRYFNSLTKDDIYRDGEGIELFKVINEDGDTDTIDSISIYESTNKAKKSSKKLSEGVDDNLDKVLDSPEFKKPISEEEVNKIIRQYESLEDLEDLNESLFNSHVSAYLNEVYENIKTFTVTACNLETPTTLVIEGLIEFKSGKSKPTKFVFEQAKNNSLVGINEDLTNEKAFTLNYSIKDKVLITESFGYKYTIENTLVEGLK